jgi:PBP1b-binding outer membrane lipoprotein LpoB
MQKSILIVSITALFFFAGCSSRPISKTWGHVKKTYNTTKQVYRTTKAVAELVNPLEYIYLSEHGEAWTQNGDPFETQDAMLGPAADSGR